MYSYLSLLLPVLSLGSFASAFTRTAEDISPFNTTLAATGLVNITASQFAPGQAINSYWTIFFLHLANGHDLFTVGQVQYTNIESAGIVETTSRASVLDITTGAFASTANTSTGLVDNPISSIDISLPEYETHFDPVDHISYMVSTSTAAGVEFNLTSIPKGNMLLDGGSGTFLWGTNITTELASPECLVTGTVKINGTDIAVVPEQSLSWFDRQYGPGFGYEGWFLWIGHFSNGVTFCIWHNEDGPNLVGQKFATLAFPDGHQEVHPIRADIKKSNPFTSSETNVTYYGHFEVAIPDLNVTVDVTIPHLFGEIVNHKSPTSDEAIFEGYSTFEGFFGEEHVTGFGVTEHKAPFSIQFG